MEIGTVETANFTYSFEKVTTSKITSHPTIMDPFEKETVFVNVST